MVVWVLAMPAEARLVDVTGRVLKYGSSEAIPDAYVQLLDDCEAPTRRALAAAPTEKDGTFRLSAEAEFKVACLYVRSNHYQGRRDRKINLDSSSVIAVGDVFLKPMRQGLVNLEGFSDHYYALKGRPVEQKALLEDVLGAQNLKEVETRFEYDPAFRQAVKDGCASPGARCGKVTGHFKNTDEGT